MHRRGPDHIPRGTVSLLYNSVVNEPKTREKIRTALTKALTSPKYVARALESIGNRLEGRPLVTIAKVQRRRTVFMPAPPVQAPGAPGSRAAGSSPLPPLTEVPLEP